MTKQTFILIQAKSLARVESRYKKPYGYKAVAQRHADAINKRNAAEHKRYPGRDKPERVVVISEADYAKRIEGMGEWKTNLLGNGEKIWVAFDTPACCDPSTETYHSM